MNLYKPKKRKGSIVAIGIFIIGAVYFGHTFMSMERNIAYDSADAVKSSIDNALMSCYAIEGSYPSSIDYLEKNYGVIIDKDKYSVEYAVQGSNIKPVVIVRTAGGKTE
ncbi:MAG: hypothetical protein IJ736_00030 [Firmicutes bacterium]|nr:hypothetical protein [Bacillota bacterium]